MGTGIAWIIAKTGWSEKIARAVAYGALAAAILLVLWGGKCTYDHAVVAKYQAQQAQHAKKATDQAAAERAQDTISTTQHEQELHDVVAAQPDAPISPTSHALACKRLHDAGRDPPACR